MKNPKKIWIEPADPICAIIKDKSEGIQDVLYLRADFVLERLKVLPLSPETTTKLTIALLC